LASFSRLVFVLFQPTPATTWLERSGMGRMDPSLVSFCADEKEVRIALCFSVHWLLSLGCDMNRPVTLFGGGAAGQSPGRLLRRTAVGRAPAQANRIGPGPYGLGTRVRQGPAARSSAVLNSGPVSIKFRL
jgi:hypothetical protein